MFNFENHPDDLFLIGAYRADKEQLSWIIKNHLYNIRSGNDLFVLRRGSQQSIMLPKFVIIYDMRSYSDIHMFECKHAKEFSQEEMSKLDYPSPSGSYVAYELGKEIYIPFVDLSKMLKDNSPAFSPVFAKGAEVASFAKKEMSTEGLERFIGLSLFASAGIAEMNLKPYIDFKVANELLPVRAKVHEFWHPNAEMVCGDITKQEIKDSLIAKSRAAGVDFIMATPPCQGVSLIGKNKRNDQFIKDARNFLIFHALELVDALDPKVVVIENVDRFAKMYFPFDDEMKSLEEILREKYKGIYNISVNVYCASDYGVPQARRRLIIVMYKDGYAFHTPVKLEKPVTVEEAIGQLPSLESGQDSGIKHHVAKKHTPAHILCMQHTPTGKSAFQNEVFYPKKADGSRVTGYPYTFKRIDWDRPAPTITMRSDAISSTHTVHPGRKLANGLYSDARVLTLRELFILSSINPDIDLPSFASDSQIRYMVGEAVPPLLMESICKNIHKK